jgi:outer membrane protease
MKTLGIVTCCVLLGYLAGIASPLGAETVGAGGFRFPYTFSAAASAGLIYGQGEEIVYKNPGNDSYLSQLLWDMKPLFYVGSSLNFSRSNPREGIGIFSDLTVRLGIPAGTGKMEDRDWLASDSYLTHLSSHHNETQGSLFLDFSLGFSFPVFPRILFKFYGSLVYMSLSWSARDGYFQYAAEDNNGYPPWDESIPKVYMFGTVINYSQKWLIISPGIALSVSLFPFLEAEFSFQIGPPVLCAAQDEHIQKKVIYRDDLSGGIYLEPRGKLIFSPLTRVELSLECSYRMIKGSRGVSSYRASDTERYVRISNFDDAGAAYSALNAGLFVKVLF